MTDEENDMARKVTEAWKIKKLTAVGRTYRDVQVKPGWYMAEDTPSLQFVWQGEPLLTASVNLGAYDLHPAPGCMWLKCYSENQGVPEQLEALGVVTLTGRRVSFGPFSTEAVEAQLVVPSEPQGEGERR